jgi:hypothetical protein
MLIGYQRVSTDGSVLHLLMLQLDLPPELVTKGSPNLCRFQGCLGLTANTYIGIKHIPEIE